MRAIQRDITFEQIVDCITNSDQVTTSQNRISCYKKLGGQYLLLVYTKDENASLVVITVLKTSQIKKYLS